MQGPHHPVYLIHDPSTGRQRKVLRVETSHPSGNLMVNAGELNGFRTQNPSGLVSFEQKATGLPRVYVPVQALPDKDQDLLVTVHLVKALKERYLAGLKDEA